MATLVRWRAADGVFANMPDLGLLRLRSYRVLGWRRPTALVTATSAVVGSGSHILIDGFTHQGRWGANALGLNDVIATVPIRGAMTEARLLQYLGHLGGSVLFVLSLILIASTGRLDRWYSTELVIEARQGPRTRGGPLLFWVPVLAAAATAVGVSQQTGRSVLFLPVLVAAIAPVVMGTLVGRSARKPVGDNTGTARLR